MPLRLPPLAAHRFFEAAGRLQSFKPADALRAARDTQCLTTNTEHLA
ncbi:hypothetical protein ACVWXO_006625 [Bradyrhizobium sp. LM2.7]